MDEARELQRIADLMMKNEEIRGDIAHSLDAIARELAIGNQLRAYAMLAGEGNRDNRQDVRDIIAGKTLV